MQKELPNIVLVILDAGSARHFSLYGYHRKTTPNIEKIARDSVVYTRCFSTATMTIPAHLSLFTGFLPSELIANGLSNGYSLAENASTLPMLLKEDGYITYGISNNHMLSKTLGFHRGFDRFYSTPRKRYMGYNCYLNSTPFTKNSVRIAQKIINAHFKDKKPFFLFMNLMDLHEKYNPPGSVRNVFVKTNLLYDRIHQNEPLYSHYFEKPFSEDFLYYLCGMYDQELLFVDKKVKEIYDHLKEKEILDNTLFIITSDHGELHGEHGQISHMYPIYNELLHIPLIIKYPADFHQSGVNDNLIQLNDIFATILNIIKSPYPIPDTAKSTLNSDKRNFAVSQQIYTNPEQITWKGKTYKRRDFMQPHLVVIRDDMWKIIKREDGFIEIYNLKEDHSESRNLANLEGPAISDLRVLLNNIEEKTNFKKAVDMIIALKETYHPIPRINRLRQFLRNFVGLSNPRRLLSRLRNSIIKTFY
jgi:arylsulfatase A-like enzyme